MDAQRKDPEDLLCWMPASVRDDGWAECGNLALKELLADLLPLNQHWDIAG